MHRGRRATAIGLIGVSLTSGLFLHLPDTAAKQDPSTPTSEICTVAPVTGPIWDGIEIAQPTAPVSISGPFVSPTGDPVDYSTLDGISSTITESIACQNAGDLRRTLALFSSVAVRGFFSGPRGYDADSVEATAAASPVPVSDDQVVGLVSIDDVVLLEDGRVGATVTTTVNDIQYVDFLTLVEGSSPDGTPRWLIDSSVAIDSQTQVEGGATEIP